MEKETQQTTNAIIGYALIILGVFAMMLSVVQVYRVFTKQTEPIQYFNFPGIKMDMSQYMPQIDTQSLNLLKNKLNINLGSTTGSNTASKETEIIPAEVINGPTNLAIYLLFMGFLMNFGAKIADLGTKLVRPIIVRGQMP